MHKIPLHGWTRHGHAVHEKTSDYHPVETRYQRLNKRLAVWLTEHVGTMTCFWVFSMLALMSLPATLHLMGVISDHFVLPSFFLTFGFIYLITWICQNYIQLVLLPALMVGQNLQNIAADIRAAKTFEDVEVILDRLDTRTEGGLTEILRAIKDLKNNEMA